MVNIYFSVFYFTILYLFSFIFFLYYGSIKSKSVTGIDKGIQILININSFCKKNIIASSKVIVLLDLGHFLENRIALLDSKSCNVYFVGSRGYHEFSSYCL